MVSHGSTSIKLWAITMFFNGVIIGMTGMFASDFGYRMLTVTFIIGGIFISSPLIFLIVQLVKLAARLPYGLAAKKAWLWYVLSIVIFLFFQLFGWICGNLLFGIPVNTYRFAGIAMIALLFAVFCLPGSFRQIYSKHQTESLTK